MGLSRVLLLSAEATSPSQDEAYYASWT